MPNGIRFINPSASHEDTFLDFGHRLLGRRDVERPVELLVSPFDLPLHVILRAAEVIESEPRSQQHGFSPVGL